MNWQHKIKIKHLLTDDEDWQSVQDNMNAVADALDEYSFMRGLGTLKTQMHNIPKGDDVFSPIDYANRLLDRLYDYCDDYAIWVD